MGAKTRENYADGTPSLCRCYNHTTCTSRHNVIAALVPVLAILVTLFVSASSAVNRNNYNVYNYDQTTPQFTPDGRLLQVEYASSAADLSPPLVVIEFENDDAESTSLSSSSSSYPCTILITLPKQPSSPQHRIVVIDEPRGNGYDTSNHYSSCYCVAMTGILSDSLALLQAGMKAAAQHSLQYKDSFGMLSLARALADECQSRVFAGGLRPYGSTMLLCGYESNDGYNVIVEEAEEEDVNNSEISNSKRTNRRSPLFQSSIYQTDPSGGILQHRAARDNSAVRPKKKKTTRKPKRVEHGSSSSWNSSVVRCRVRCVVGGQPGVQRQLHKRINEGMAKFEQKNQRNHRSAQDPQPSLSLAQRIANVAKILIKETSETKTSGSNKNGSTRSSTKRHNSKKEDALSPLSPSAYPLEIVIVSPIWGCHRLEGKQLEAIQTLIDA